MTSRRRRALRAAAVVSELRRPTADAARLPDALDPTVTRGVSPFVLDFYQRHCGGPSGRLGLPVGDEQPISHTLLRAHGFDREQRFEHGTIYLDTVTGRVDTVRWRFGVPSRPPPYDMSQAPPPQWCSGPG